ncbi:hypothetical protein [Dokdonia sp.]|uniref:hypothetical protein n=1 Tax=Dokdonia sp. TaxID=2024995 RepID=UPI003267772A
MKKNNDIPKDINYNVPDDYFIDFQERLQVQIEFEELLGSKRETGFKVPDGYFDSFANKIEIQTKPEPKVITLYKNKWAYAIAGVAAIVLFLFLILPKETQISFESIENDSIAEYLEIDNSLLSEYDLGALLTDEEFDDLSNTIQFEDSELIDYLDITTDQYDLMIQ